MSPRSGGWFLVFLAAAAVAGDGPDTDWKIAVFPSGAEFVLELARTEEERARGYMFRERVGPGEGMLFVFEQRDRHGIWMLNCRVPLDLIWLDDAFRVVDLALNVPPCAPGRPCPSTTPGMPARYVLEVAGGRAEAEGLAIGDTVVTLSDPDP
jgi:uncharacterized membrane protein (UPF0127 family)